MVKSRLTITHLHADGETHLSDFHIFEDATWDDTLMAAAEKLRSFAELPDRQIISAVLSNEERAANGATMNKTFQPKEWEPQ